VILRQDGTVLPLSVGQNVSGTFYDGCGGNSFIYSAPSMPLSPQQGTTYYTADHLGSAQLGTASGGWPVWQGHFAPFGQELNPQTTSSHYKFTGKERDAESGLDYFGARYYGSNMGRFTSPDDDSDQAPSDPQSWNLYSYVRNNPLTNTDPDGHDCINTSNLQKDGTVSVTSGTSCASDPGKYGTYVAGTVDTKSLTTDGKGSVGYNFTSYDGQSGGGGVIAPNAPYGPLEGPANIAGANMIGNGGMGMVNMFMKNMAYSAAGELVGQGIGYGLEALGAANAAKRAVDLANLSNKIRRQMVTRGWTAQEIAETVEQGVAHAAENKATGGAATEFVNPSNGKFVVVDNATKQVLQVSGEGHLPNYMMK